MTILAGLSLVLGVFLSAVSMFAVLCDHALNITVKEREMWYQPLKPIEFEVLDAECEDE